MTIVIVDRPVGTMASALSRRPVNCKTLVKHGESLVPSKRRQVTRDLIVPVVHPVPSSPFMSDSVDLSAASKIASVQPTTSEESRVERTWSFTKTFGLFMRIVIQMFHSTQIELRSHRARPRSPYRALMYRKSQTDAIDFLFVNYVQGEHGSVLAWPKARRARSDLFRLEIYNSQFLLYV